MDDSTASTSADPLTLPSSPLVRHYSPRKPNARPLRSRSPSKQHFSSPAKSFIMDTGDGGNDQSPWRIKVTVQAEPRDGTSPGKKPITKTTTVPLKGGSSSPAKRPARRKKVAEVEESEMEVEIKRPQRKRKGTPMRRAVKRPTPAKVAEEDERVLNEGQEQEVAVVSSPTKKPAKKGGRRSLGTMPTQRGQRLSQAREELDEALQDAINSSDPAYDDNDVEAMPVSEAMHTDMTAMNEDFTMISVETLQSMKQNTSMLDDSQVGDRPAVNGSFWPSSPPQDQNSARKSAQDHSSAAKTAQIDYPNISAQAQYARDTPGYTPAKSFVQAFDAMSWKPTGRARPEQEPTPAESSELQHESGKKQTMEEEWQAEREKVSRQIEHAPKEDVVVVEDEEEEEAALGAEQSADEEEGDEVQGEDEDIWAEEASRSLEEDVESSHLSHRSSRQPPHHAKSSTAEDLNDLFSGVSSKPTRAKIPRTWRRSSGMDFQYSDSPAHSFAQQGQGEQEVRKDSETSGSDEELEGEDDEAERESGVLTPPSTDEDDQDEEDEDMIDDDAEVGDEEIGVSRSAFEPDAAATELQVRQPKDHDLDPEEEEESDESAPSPEADGEDTGLFWQNNLPNVYKRPVRPRLAEQRKAKDLSDLLKDTESSRIVTEKKPSPVAPKPAPVQAATQPAKRFPGSRLLAARREAASSSFTSTSSNEQSVVVGEKAKEKVVSSPLRKSLLKSSKVGGAVTAGSTATLAAARDAKSGGREAGARRVELLQQETINESVGNTSLSFASKASDQRQLLEETRATPAAKPRRKVASHVEVPKEEQEESLWQAAGAEDQIEDDEDEEEEASSPAQSVDYSAAGSEVRYTDDYESEDDVEEAEYESDNIVVSQSYGDSTAHSYEEHLNISSPQKIRVNFGESSTATAGNSSLLQPKRTYPPLFEQRPPSRGHQHSRQEERTLVSKPQPQPTEPGLLSKLTSTFWSAVIRPSGPTLITEPVFPASLRTQLRSRYGVLSNQHPWTMSHMRTLHRIMNSCSSGKADSLVPRPGVKDLPSQLAGMAGKKHKDPCGRIFVLSEQLALVVWSFMQTLVPHALIQQIEAGEIDFIGDSMALSCRGYFDEYNGKPRHGSDKVFANGEIKERCPRDREVIATEWVARCVGACVFAQREYEAREEKIRTERKAWEARNGTLDEDDGEVLQKVRRA